MGPQRERGIGAGGKREQARTVHDEEKAGAAGAAQRARERRQWLRLLLVTAVLLVTAFFGWRSAQLPAVNGRAAGASADGLADEDIWQLSMEELEERIGDDLAAARPAVLDWRVLRELDLESGERSALLARLDGKRVRVPGFAVPLEDYAEDFAEFLLVPYAGACIHTPPPPGNQMIYAQMQGGRRARTPWWEPIWLEGTLHIVPTRSPYGAVGYQLEGLGVAPFTDLY